MTNDEVIKFFAGRQLPTGRVTFSGYKSTDDVANMVKLGIDRMQQGGNGANTARAGLVRLAEYLKGVEN